MEEDGWGLGLAQGVVKDFFSHPPRGFWVAIAVFQHCSEMGQCTPKLLFC
jgi:hypothetical protein